MPRPSPPFPAIISRDHQLQSFVERAFPKLRTVEAAEFEILIREELRKVSNKFHMYLICEEYFRCCLRKPNYLRRAEYVVQRSFLGLFKYKRRYHAYIRVYLEL